MKGKQLMPNEDEKNYIALPKVQAVFSVHILSICILQFL